MKESIILLLIFFSSVEIFAQSVAQKIFETEKAFEKAAAEKGINQSFIDFSTTDAVCFLPGYPVNCHEFFKGQKPSTAFLQWNPTFIDVSANGVLAYSFGNSIYRANGKEDSTAYYGHYVTVWQKQPDGNYLSVFDVGTSNPKPDKIETDWKTSPDSNNKPGESSLSAANTSRQFFETSQKMSLDKAYQNFLAEDVKLFREGKLPISGKKNALNELKKSKDKIKFSGRSIFTNAADLAYFSNSYTMFDKNGKESEKGNFLQIWKLRNGSWQIVLDLFLPLPKQ